MVGTEPAQHPRLPQHPLPLTTSPHEVLDNSRLAPDVHRLEVRAERVAAAGRPGQFVIVRLGPGAERIPLTIADADVDAGTISLVIQAVGKSTRDLVALRPRERIDDVAGPLGRPSTLVDRRPRRVRGRGRGRGRRLPDRPGAATRRCNGDHRARRALRDRVLLAAELAEQGRVVVCTEDGSEGRRGLVTDALPDVLRDGAAVVYAAGPVAMMRAVAELTRTLGIRTIVSLNPIMVDGTGMCGGCRVTVGGRMRFACVDGPEFDAHEVDFDELADRLTIYRPFERGRPREDGGRSVNAAAPLSKRERLAIPRQDMPVRDAHVRIGGFEEVNLGFTEQVALVEARRCLQCRVAPCVAGCPVGVDIPAFLARLEDGDLAGAADVLLAGNALPGVTGRVCPQENQCEARCVLARKGQSVAIGHLERFVADWAREHRQPGSARGPRPRPVRPGRVAIVGSGPGGLTAAGELAGLGHEVTIYEALHVPGGVLVYGIPEFRLPNEIVAHEVARLEDLGVRFECNAVIGRTYTLDELRGGFDAVFVAVGAGLPVFLDVPGEGLKGVYSANEYLTRVNLMQAYAFPGADTPVLHGRRVVVVGGRQRGARRGADGATPRRGRGDPRLPAHPGRDARAGRGDPARRGGGHPLRTPRRPRRRARRRGSVGDGRRVHPHGAGRARRLRPPPAGPGGGHGARHPLRHRRGGHRDPCQPAADHDVPRSRARAGGQRRHRRAGHDQPPRRLRGRRHRPGLGDRHSRDG